MRLVLLGPPGAGKGTQATFVAQHFAIPAISTGDIFRANIADGTPLGKVVKDILDSGGLVPDDVTVDIVRDRLAQPDTEPGFLLDGFPRTLPQAETLQGMLEDLGVPLDRVLEIRVDDDEIVQRLSGRRVCPNGHVWHVDFNPPAADGVCDVDGGPLFQRDDDKPETVRNRLHVYARDTAPLVDFYQRLGLLVSIPGDGEVDEVAKRAIAAVSGTD